MSVAIKICGITRVQDGVAAASLGANAIGLMFFRGSARFVTLARAKEIITAIPPFVSVVAVFVNPEKDQVTQIIDNLSVDLLQFHGDESAEFCTQFSRPYIKAVRVKPGVDLLQYAIGYSQSKGLLVDAFIEGSQGGTGQVFDWSLIPKNISRPLILSGGLNSGNVKQAVAQVKPWAVDVSSGVETEKGIKDAMKIAAFIREARYEVA